MDTNPQLDADPRAAASTAPVQELMRFAGGGITQGAAYMHEPLLHHARERKNELYDLPLTPGERVSSQHSSSDIVAPYGPTVADEAQLEHPEQDQESLSYNYFSAEHHPGVENADEFDEDTESEGAHELASEQEMDDEEEENVYAAEEQCLDAATEQDLDYAVQDLVYSDKHNMEGAGDQSVDAADEPETVDHSMDAAEDPDELDMDAVRDQSMNSADELDTVGKQHVDAAHEHNDNTIEHDAMGTTEIHYTKRRGKTKFPRSSTPTAKYGPRVKKRRMVDPQLNAPTHADAEDDESIALNFQATEDDPQRNAEKDDKLKRRPKSAPTRVRIPSKKRRTNLDEVENFFDEGYEPYKTSRRKRNVDEVDQLDFQSFARRNSRKEFATAIDQVVDPAPKMLGGIDLTQVDFNTALSNSFQSSEALRDWKTESASYIGHLCKVYWSADSTWFVGRIINYDPISNKFYIFYQDQTTEKIAFKNDAPDEQVEPFMIATDTVWVRMPRTPSWPAQVSQFAFLRSLKS
jgi:hypothetical protein